MIHPNDSVSSPKARISKTAVIYRPSRVGDPTAQAFAATADAALDPLLNAALAMKVDAGKSTALPLDETALVTALGEQIARIESGDLEPIAKMLWGQASTLQAQFVRLSRLASAEPAINAKVKLANLALRAQDGARSTLEMLINLQHPTGSPTPGTVAGERVTKGASR